MPKSVEDELSGPTVFKDRKVVDFDWVPPRLWHRDDELGKLSQLFRGVAEGSMGQRALITGEVGTGKSALAKFFCQKFQEAVRPKGLIVEFQWVNCRQNASEGLVLLQLLKKFDPNYPERGYSTNEMLNDLRKQIDRRGVHFVALLDEVDALVRKEKDLVYALSRFDDQRTVRKPTLSLLLVSSKEEELFAMMDEATRSTIKQTNVVRLSKYTPRQLRDIVADRVALGFHRGAVRDDVIDLVIDITGKEGDARYAIELLETAGRAADEEHSDRILPDHVRSAKAHTRSFVSADKLRQLGRQQLCVLLAVARKLKRSKKTYLTTGEAESAYKLVAEEVGEPVRAHTQFWKYLKELETADWLHLKLTGTSDEGQTQHISLQDLPAPILVEKIEGLLARRATAP